MKNAKRPKHIAFIKSLPCAACGKSAPSEAAHVRHGNNCGMGYKPDDKHTVPLCDTCHRVTNEAQHYVGDELGWWNARGKNPHEISQRLFELSGDQITATAYLRLL